jgi:hypothetical protein
MSGFGGYLLAFLLELPVGATQTLLAAVFTAITWPFGRHTHQREAALKGEAALDAPCVPLS